MSSSSKVGGLKPPQPPRLRRPCHKEKNPEKNANSFFKIINGNLLNSGGENYFIATFSTWKTM
jgi:hypothetical protein